MQKIWLSVLLFPLFLKAQTLPDSTQLLHDAQWLSSDALGGRRFMTAGNEAASAYIAAVFDRYQLKKWGDSYYQPFVLKQGSAELKGRNVLGYVTGTEHPEMWMVISAHYDHLGTLNQEVFNGADDNASGTAALLQLAAYFSAHPPKHSILFAAWDAEEMGLIGARQFVANPPIPVADIALNLNMDMIGRNESRELYITGTHQNPFLKSIVEPELTQSRIHLRFGHDKPEDYGAQNWVSASDQGAFHDAGVPFLYFGVEDHPDYHRPTDDFERLMPSFYWQATQSILRIAEQMDANLPAIMVHRKSRTAR